ncbi:MULTISPECIES: hypothetical protein [unclassified Paraburkholderia]|uniref:hypothetical protein n=1 Tax=unclassified Paraburkholderia TaxID=2615204 RepID=UPI002AB16AA0|nr:MULTISPECIES: hypothetical protein [unclassified Paraburkholderia]
MHVIGTLSSDMYDVEVSQKPATMWDVFPEWNAQDRFGIVIYEPLAGIGATHLIQLACMCFYDVKPSRRAERKIYPEIFAIHVGQWRGAHGNFDFWPARREHLVSDDHRDILGAINDRGITRLAIPERPPRDLVHRRKEEDCALDRIVTATVYDPSGRVADPDFTVRSNSSRTERDVERVIRPVELSEEHSVRVGKSAVPVKEGDPEFGPRLCQLNVGITPQMREAAESRRVRIKENNLVMESYRFIRPELALKCL